MPTNMKGSLSQSMYTPLRLHCLIKPQIQCERALMYFLHCKIHIPIPIRTAN